MVLDIRDRLYEDIREDILSTQKTALDILDEAYRYVQDLEKDLGVELSSTQFRALVEKYIQQLTASAVMRVKSRYSVTSNAQQLENKVKEDKLTSRLDALARVFKVVKDIKFFNKDKDHETKTS